ncbi:MAG: S-ribosylhomocysteine lyase [Clostridia bacterium]|nr:S-ribosylhomocysteine lyase [Clostridia bacterium]
MNKITSFTVDHDKITPGIYISRIDGDITTFDLRTRTPNAGDYMDDLTMHSVEHMMATFLRNSEIKDGVIYFGPMGCQTGFYLLTRDISPEKVLETVKKCLKMTVEYDGEMLGAKRKECGNYKNLSLDAAKAECERYLTALESKENDFKYEE